MKRGILSSIALMIFMVLPQDVFALTRYSEKVWYEKPAFTLTPQPNSEFLTFMSNLTADRVILLPKGKILLRRGDLLEIYGPDFDVIRYFKNLKKTIGWDEVHGYGVLIPSRDGKKLIIGFANRELRQYNLVLFNLETGEHKFLTTLDKMHFPGIAPIKRAMEIIKTDPEFANIYFSRVYNSFDFEDGTWIDDKIYLWFAPEYGLHFGGLLVYDLSIGQLTPFLEKADHIIGVSKDGLIAYTHLKDDNATELDKAIYIKTTKSTIRIPDASIEKGACFNGEILVYTTHDKKVVFYSVKKKTPVASFNMPGKDFRMIELSPSGNRLFFTAQIETAPPTLYVYDTRDRKYYPIITDGRHIDTISFLNSSNDGEFVVFREGSRVWASYLTDYSAPQITLKINPLYKNKAFTESVTVKAYAEDMCFTSGIQEPAIEFDKKKYRSGDEIKVILKEGENILIFKASDRAGNVNLLKKKIILEKPLKTTLREIGENPQKYVGKVLLLEGYAWGWYAKNRPPEVEKLSKLPLAKGNTAKTRNTGTFSDGTALAFFPIIPVEAGKFRIYAIIHIVKDKWLLEPLLKKKYNSRKSSSDA